MERIMESGREQLRIDRSDADNVLFKDKELINYFLGILEGDGSIYYDGGVAVVQWQSSDPGWAREVFKAVKIGNMNEYTPEGRLPIACFACRDYFFVKCCVDHGMGFRKSVDEEQVAIPDEGYEWEFLQGLFEADGSVSWTPESRSKTGYGKYAIYWMGNLKTCEWVKNFLARNLVASSLCEVWPGVYRTTVNTAWSQKVVRAMFYRGSVWLERKKEEFDNLIAERGEAVYVMSREELLLRLAHPKEGPMIRSMDGKKLADYSGLSYRSARRFIVDVINEKGN